MITILRCWFINSVEMLFQSNWEWCCCIWFIYSNIVWYWIVFLSNWYEMGSLIESCSSSIWLFMISIESWFVIEFKYVWSSLNCWWDWICSSHLIVWDGCDEYSYLIQFNVNFICAVWMNMDRIEWIVFSTFNALRIDSYNPFILLLLKECMWLNMKWSVIVSVEMKVLRI